MTRDYKEKRSRKISKEQADQERGMHIDHKIRRTVLSRLEQKDHKDLLLMLDPEELLDE